MPGEQPGRSASGVVGSGVDHVGAVDERLEDHQPQTHDEHEVGDPDSHRHLLHRVLRLVGDRGADQEPADPERHEPERDGDRDPAELEPFKVQVEGATQKAVQMLERMK